MRSSSRYGIAYPLLLSAVISLLLVYYLFISLRYPYYFIWDMDQVVVMDAVLIQSGLLPDHINHPGFGLYLPVVLSARIGHFVHALSATSLQELTASLNPLWCIAEYAEFVRLQIPFLLLGMVLCLWTALCILFPLRRWQALLFLLILGLNESLSYHASMIRTEQYSLFYWALAVLLTTLAATTPRRPVRSLCLSFTGVCLGLSLFTKIQSLILLGSFPFLMLLIFSLGRRTLPTANITRHGMASRIAFAALGLINLLLFALLLRNAYVIHIPEGFATFATAFGVNPTAILFLAGFLLLALVSTLLLIPLRIPFFIGTSTRTLLLLATGFLASMLLHFLLYKDPSTALAHLLYDAKIVFLRKNPFAIKYPDIFLQPRDMMRYTPVLFIAHLALLAMLCLGKATRSIRLSASRLALCLLLTLLAFANLCLGIRFYLRDLLWAEFTFNFLSLLYLAMILDGAVKTRWIWKTGGTALAVAILLAACIHQASMPKRIAANYNRYGWDIEEWLRPVYRQNHLKYSELMDKRYNYRTRQVALQMSSDFGEVRNILRFVFQNQTITLKNAGIASPGFPVSTADSACTIQSIPQELHKGIVVDNAQLATSAKGCMKMDLVREHSEVLDKLRKAPNADAYAILPRPDLKVYLAYQQSDAQRSPMDVIIPTPYQIVVRNPGGYAETMQVAEISNYAEIPKNALQGDFFFIICHR